ncbi:MAG: protoporphyrinogen oxidase [Elusimicrobiota bacterium]|jgi:oxygen-dependent protoporphyrinogen oxidase
MTQGQSRKVAVLGAGITGLAAAYELCKRGRRGGPSWEVAVFEADTRVGGKIRTENNEGAVCETGPDSFITAKPQALELVRELGLESELLRTNQQHRAVFMLCGGRLVPMPEGISLVLPTRLWPFLRSGLLTWPGKLRMAMEPFVPRLSGEGDESLAAFFERRLGPEAVAKLVAPLLGGIFAGDASKLSLNSTFPQFAEMERRGGLLREFLRARRPRSAPAADVTMFMTLKGGLCLLPETLARRLPAGCLRLGAAVKEIVRRGSRWEVRSARGREEFDAVVSALPAPALAGVVEGMDVEFAGVLREIPFASSAVVTLAYERRDFSHPLEGFGMLVPRAEGRRLNAATFSSTKFPGRVPPGLVVLRGFLGGAGRDADAEADEAQVARTARNELRDILGLGQAHPRWTRAARWPRANPQYNVGHGLRLKRLESCLQAHPGLILAGDSFRGVGLPDCIRSGGQAAQRLLSSAGGRQISGVA